MQPYIVPPSFEGFVSIIKKYATDPFKRLQIWQNI